VDPLLLILIVLVVLLLGAVLLLLALQFLQLRESRRDVETAVISEKPRLQWGRLRMWRLGVQTPHRS